MEFIFGSMGKNEFVLDKEITLLNTPDRYDSQNKRYNYSEEDIRNLFDKRESNSSEVTVASLFLDVFSKKIKHYRSEIKKLEAQLK